MALSTDNWDSWTYTTLDGGNVPQSEIEEARRDMDLKTFEQEYLATFNTYSGMVYYNFDRKAHLKSYPNPDVKEIFVGQDFNVGALASAIAIIEGDTVFFVDELLLDSSSTEDTCDELKRRYPNSKITMFPDPAGRQRRSSAGGRTDISILQNAGFNVQARNSHTPVRDRVNAVNSKLKNARGEIKLFVDPRCKNIINSLEKMVYKPGTNVIDKDGKLDHMADACGYLIDYLYPVRTEYAPQEPQRWAFSGNNNTARRWN